MAINLSIARDFSETPGPRYIVEGEYSGEQFRKDLLEPAFVKARDSRQPLIVDLDGVVGYATSFLEEAFGGLARIYDPGDVLKSLELVCKDEPSLVEEVRRYITDTNSEHPTERGQ